ncbi:hypothetical protein TeGR_g6972 [Tetraparma gracilis]|uniref:non-specific serine/threonine protein kinase n=1 Tax=Tetraparma gracilis TaxID=2962635 RepID=A0ABQ6M4F1_9STRA|nr:hypothetical protein TeGR_g6972 [Tetraparma gracilis]
MRDFKLIGKLGAGAFAAVTKVERKADGKTYALKRVNISKMKPAEVSDTLNEIRFLSSVRHPYIVGFLEAFLDRNDTELCIIMEYCSYGDLAEKVERYKKRRQYIDEKVVWAYLVQCLEALTHLHSKRICHRDLKPANCFLCDDGTIKIGDMNVSKRMKHGLLKTQIGTPYYMSPEIWANKPYNESSDMWALGCLIYELCALTPPFVGDSFPQLKRVVMQGRYKAVPRCYSYEMSTVVGKLLRVGASSRPSAKDLLASPEVQKYMKPGGYGAIAPESHRPIDLMATIVVPAGPKRRISAVLPAPCYPDARPNSPTKWPVSARDRKDAIAKKAGGNLGPVDENAPAEPATEQPKAKPAPSPAPIKARGGASHVIPSARAEATRAPRAHKEAPAQQPRKALAPVNGNRGREEAGGKRPPRPTARDDAGRRAGARPGAAQYAPANREGLQKPARPGREGGGGRPRGNVQAKYGAHGAAQRRKGLPRDGTVGGGCGGGGGRTAG